MSASPAVSTAARLIVSRVWTVGRGLSSCMPRSAKSAPAAAVASATTDTAATRGSFDLEAFAGFACLAGLAAFFEGLAAFFDFTGWVSEASSAARRARLR